MGAEAFWFLMGTLLWTLLALFGVTVMALVFEVTQFEGEEDKDE